MKRFNTTGVCLSSQHYMVDLTERVKEIKAMIDCGDYFCINRGRQYGKTTTLDALKNALAMDYTVFSISFEGHLHLKNGYVQNFWIYCRDKSNTRRSARPLKI